MTIPLRPPFEDEASAVMAYGDTARVGVSAEPA